MKHIMIAIALQWAFLPMNSFANALPQNIQEYLDSASITEYGVPSDYDNQQAQDFINYVKANYASLLANLASVAPDTRKQALLLVGFQHLEGEDYLTFLQAVNAQYQSNTIPVNFFSEVYHENFVFKKGFLAYNYQHPLVSPILESAESQAPSGHKVKLHLQRLISGEAYTSIKAYIEYEELTAPDILPNP